MVSSACVELPRGPFGLVFSLRNIKNITRQVGVSLERRLKRGGSAEEEEENEGHGEGSKEGDGDVKEEENVFLQLYSAFPGDKGCWAVFLLQLHR